MALRRQAAAFILLFASFTAATDLCVSAADLSPRERLDAYKAEAAEAEQARNARLTADTYAKITELCRDNAALNDELPENLYLYGMWSGYAGDYAAAINALVEVLDMPDEEVGGSLYQSKAQANMYLGIIYFFMERWDDALGHYRTARDMAVALGNSQGISIAENNIGNIYQKKGEFGRAVEQYQLCLQLQEELGDRGTICNTLYNIGTCYNALHREEEAVPYFEESLSIARDIPDPEIHALCLSKLALHNATRRKRFAAALEQINEAERLAADNGYKQVSEEVYDIRSRIEEERGDFAAALEYHKKFKTLSDTLFSERSVDRIHEYEVRYQTQQKELEIVRQQAEINRRKGQLAILAAVLVLSGAALFLLWMMLRIRARRNAELREMNETKDKFFSIISHDLKNPAIAQRNALRTLAENGGEWSRETLTKYYAELLRSADIQLDLLYNLLNWAQFSMGRMPYEPCTFDLAAALRPEIEMSAAMAARKGVELTVVMPDEAVVTGDRNMLSTVVRNLLSNAVKFTGSGGVVSLEVETSSGGFAVSVTDTGTGMSEAVLAGLFRLDKRRSQRGTAGEQGSGLGLIVCRELLEKHGNRLEVESTEGKGSRFRFVIN